MLNHDRLARFCPRWTVGLWPWNWVPDLCAYQQYFLERGLYVSPLRPEPGDLTEDLTTTRLSLGGVGVA